MVRKGWPLWMADRLAPDIQASSFKGILWKTSSSQAVLNWCLPQWMMRNAHREMLSLKCLVRIFSVSYRRSSSLSFDEPIRTWTILEFAWIWTPNAFPSFGRTNGLPNCAYNCLCYSRTFCLSFLIRSSVFAFSKRSFVFFQINFLPPPRLSPLEVLPIDRYDHLNAFSFFRRQHRSMNERRPQRAVHRSLNVN